MKRLMNAMVLLIAVTLITLGGCKKEEPTQSSQNENSVNLARGAHAKTFNSEVAQKWMKMQMQIMRTTGGISNLAFVRPFAYSGVTFYQSLIPGMPSYQTLSGQLGGLPDMPQVESNLEYYWPASANAAMASFLKKMYPTASAANVFSVDSLEAALKTQYSANASTDAISRSVDYGKAVAQIVFDWSATDGANHANDPYVSPVGPQYWVSLATPAAAPLGPYWGNIRVMVSGSGNNAQPPAPPVYSEVPGSDFYNMVKQVYDVSQTLTQAQIDQGMYWRDVPGLSTPGHYLSILEQVLEKDNSSLEIAAAAYALSGITVYDCSISSWQTKYIYNLVRPITYIRNVLLHTTWSPLLTTPGHPEYSSAHASLSFADAVALESIFGANYSFTDHSYDYLGFPSRSFSSFQAFGEDAGNSRLYAGIHYQLSIDRSFVQGRTIAQNIINTLVLKKP